LLLRRRFANRKVHQELGWRPYQPANPGKVVCESRCGRKTATKREQRQSFKQEGSSMPQTTIPAALIAEYQNTDYSTVIDGAERVLRIGEPAAWLAAIFAELQISSALFITAENPFSALQTADLNAAATGRLRGRLEREAQITFAEAGSSQESGWPSEKSFLALGLNEARSKALGEEFRQNAVVCIGSDAVPQLIQLV
jgi:hypothetical protein